MTKNLLLIVDRDGTLIEDANFLGKNGDWRNELAYKEETLESLRMVQDAYATKTYMVTNQSGVARKLFSEDTVREINDEVAKKLEEEGITLNGIQYCPDVDESYATSHPEMDFDPRYVKESTKRKPSPQMVHDALAKDGYVLDDFAYSFVFGDRVEDESLAKNIGGYFLNVHNEPDIIFYLVKAQAHDV